MGRQRNESGRFGDGIDPDEVLAVFEQREDIARPVTASDVVDAMGIARRTAHNKLNRLVERGVLDTRKIGAKGRVWWMPMYREDVHEKDARGSDDTPDRHATTDTDDTAAAAADVSEPRERNVTPARSDAEPMDDTRTKIVPTIDTDADGDPLASVEFPSSRTRDDCEAAVYAAREYIRRHGPVTMREIVAGVIRDHPVGYNVDGALAKIEAGERYRGGWWRHIVKPGLRALPEIDGPSRGGARDWRYVGEE